MVDLSLFFMCTVDFENISELFDEERDQLFDPLHSQIQKNFEIYVDINSEYH